MNNSYNKFEDEKDWYEVYYKDDELTQLLSISTLKKGFLHECILTIKPNISLQVGEHVRGCIIGKPKKGQRRRFKVLEIIGRYKYKNERKELSTCNKNEKWFEVREVDCDDTVMLYDHCMAEQGYGAVLWVKPSITLVIGQEVQGSMDINPHDSVKKMQFPVFTVSKIR